MAFLGKSKDEQQYGRLMGMIQPEASPTKRVGTEAPIGGVTAGPKAGQTAAEFTKAAGGPGAAFQRQLKGADISGITKVAEQPLLREAGQEAARVAGEAKTYQETQANKIQQAPQYSADELQTAIGKLGAGDVGETEKAQKILGGAPISVDKFSTADIKEFTPLQALRGGSVENLIRREASGPMTTGMAALDALLFKQKGGAAELAKRGTVLRAGEQAIADALQGRSQGVLDKDVQARLAAAGLSADLTKEAEGKAEQFVKGQKESLTEAIKKGLSKTEDKYLKPTEAGQQSELQKAQAKLDAERISKQMAGRGKAEEFIKKQKNEINNALIQQTAARLFPDDVGQFMGIYAIMNDPAKMQAILNDPAYKAQKQKADESVLSAPISPAQFVRTPEVPQLGLANIMTAEDAAAYNRLQGLIGGKGVQAKQIQAGEATIDEQAIRNTIADLLNKANLFPTPEKQQMNWGSFGSGFGTGSI